MADYVLAQMSYKRLAGQLPNFPGTTVREKLMAGRGQAEAVLRKYVPSFRFDESAAESVLYELDTWAERNHDRLAEALDPQKNPTNDLPTELRLELGASKAQQFVIASFTRAAAGLGPWNAGEVARLAASGGTFIGKTLIDENWAMSDASQRLDTFATIVAMDTRGDLKLIFQADGASGLGLEPGTIVLIAVLTAIFAAALVTFLVFDRNLERNNLLMRDICAEAQRRGDKAVVEECVRATADLQDTLIGGIGREIAKGVIILGGVYVAAKYLLPKIFERRKRVEAT